MKSRWQEKRLDDACDLITCGVAARPKYVDAGVPFLSAKNVKDGKIVWRGYNCVSKETHDQLTKHNKPLLGDLLYTRVGSFGEAAVIEDEIDFSVFVSLTLIKPNKHLLNNYFLKHFLNSSEVKEMAKRSISSSGVGNLNVGAVREFPIAFPSLPEQQRIVGILDEALEGIATAKASAEKNLQNARALFETYLQSVFTQRGKGWVEDLVGSLCDVTHGYAFDGAEFSRDVPDDKPLVITPGNFTEDGKLLFNDRNTKRFSGNPPRGFRFEVGDLVVVMTDLSSKMKILGKPAFVEMDDVLHNQRIGRVVFRNDRIEKRFLYYFMMSDGFLKNIKGSATGTMVKHTAPKRILGNVIPFPPSRGAQRDIIRRLDSLREETQHLESIYKQKLAALEALKKSLLHKAFTGEL